MQEFVHEIRMTKTTSKERGKGPGRGKGRLSGKEDVPDEDGSWGSEAERLRQRILETVAGEVEKTETLTSKCWS